MGDKTGMFHITMGSYDGAEACELIGAYMLNRIYAPEPARSV